MKFTRGERESKGLPRIISRRKDFLAADEQWNQLGHVKDSTYSFRAGQIVY